MSHHSLHNSKLCQIYLVGTVKWGDIEQQGDIEPQSYPSMETHWIVSLTVMLQDVCVLDCSLKVFVPQPQNLWNVPTTFDLLFLPKLDLNNNFQMKKFDV